jgi:nucleotide-binding universal stress UspA family protein
MMTVIVAVDGSAGSRSAILLAASEARWRQVPLVGVTAYRTDRTAAPAGRPLSTLRTRADDQDLAESALQDALLDALGPEHGKVKMIAVAGHAGRAIVDAARRTRADLIVLAARSGISVLPGSVSQYILRNARCPVLMVPAGLGRG